MVAVDEGQRPIPAIDTKQIREALDRGELVRLLADVEAGRLRLEDLEAALTERDHQWFRAVVRAFFGR